MSNMNETDKISFSEVLDIKSKDGGVEHITDGDSFHPGTHVTIRDKRTGAIVFKGSNKAMLAASEMMAYWFFGVERDSIITPTYNTQLELDNSESNTGNDMTLKYKTYLFCIGTSGCPAGSKIKNEVVNKNWIRPEDLVPFRYQPVSDDLNSVYRGIYFGRKTMTDRNRIAYYFKKFDSDPIVSKVYDDGTPWSSSVYDDSSVLKAFVKISLTASVDNEDGRDWFDYTSGINDGKFNCLELCMAWANVDLNDGYTYFQDVRPITRLNFTDKDLAEKDASWEIKYDLIF